MPTCLRLLVLSLLLLTSAAAAPMPWARLKVGMSADEIVALLGEPVFRTQGRGFETWTYDHGAEVLVYGLVVGWTVPASATQLARSHDVWSHRPAGDYLAAMRTALHKAAPKAAIGPAAKPVRGIRPANPGLGYEEYSRARG